MIKTCKTCGFANYGNFCPAERINITPNQPACPKYQEELVGCSICGNVIFKNTGTYSTDLNIWVCDNCAELLYTCVTCKHRKTTPKCVIEQYHGDKSPFIKVIKKIGFMQAESTQLNPEVLDEVCPTCTCKTPYNCQKNGRCDNWESGF